MVNNDKTKLIVDTDIEVAYDDAGALVVMHALSARGEVEILAVICDSVDSNGGPCIDMINRYYNRFDIPVGTVRVKNFESSDRYAYYRNYMRKIPKERRFNENIIVNTPLEKMTNRDYCNAVELYRKVLSKQTDHSVVICAIGYLTAIEQLLKSDADMYSPLNGHDLVRLKVKKIVTMSDMPFPEEGDGAFNWDMDMEAAQYVINKSPSPIYISKYGRNILTGKNLLTKNPEGNPILKAFQRAAPEDRTKMSSWDEVAMLYAVRGEGPLFREEKGYELNYDGEKNKFTWRKSTTGRKDAFVDINVTNEVIAHVIDELMEYKMG
jgi:inosine-uridine nucleoside N-ribohydrolase